MMRSPSKSIEWKIMIIIQDLRAYGPVFDARTSFPPLAQMQELYYKIFCMDLKT